MTKSDIWRWLKGNAVMAACRRCCWREIYKLA